MDVSNEIDIAKKNLRSILITRSQLQNTQIVLLDAVES